MCPVTTPWPPGWREGAVPAASTDNRLCGVGKTPPALLGRARGSPCPLPVLKARKAMRGVAPGGLLKVLATDPGATAADFAAFCEVTGHCLEASGEEDGARCFLIRARA